MKQFVAYKGTSLFLHLMTLSVFVRLPFKSLLENHTDGRTN